MSIDTFNYGERAGFLERLGKLAGTTTFRTKDSGGGVPYVVRRMASENELALALAMARRNPRDIGPDMAYTVGTGTAHRERRVKEWLIDKLSAGTGKTGRKCAKWLPAVAHRAYDLIGYGKTTRPIPDNAPAEFEVLVNIAVGWLWMSVESAIERAEYAYRYAGRPRPDKNADLNAA